MLLNRRYERYNDDKNSTTRGIGVLFFIGSNPLGHCASKSMYVHVDKLKGKQHCVS